MNMKKEIKQKEMEIESLFDELEIKLNKSVAEFRTPPDHAIIIELNEQPDGVPRKRVGILGGGVLPRSYSFPAIQKS